ncbi:TlpA disulfide reductase family protein [Pedobacter sp. KR3-3]|uniref:TlpA disulfide reductase family protein n=1 Tax=Pedobacter albus TaxID=3113905 RepID=A0ABU7ICX6_9SPHI|nr:TlpA disulfide reductase family protein [Pedobacter sp. KR3-3]MEE1947126.1 TlpA disulfide reductase family protein [Pedobacter sp. KR3-3]
MKTSITFIIATLALSTGASAQKPATAEAVLNQTNETLHKLKSISYHSYREINNFKDDYFAKNSGDSYFEYDNAMDGKTARFQLGSADALQVYNGTEYFYLNQKNKTIALERKTAKQLNGLSLLYNSVTSIRLVLPQLLQDASIPKSLADTLIDGKSYYLVKFDLHKKSMEFPNGFSSFDSEVTKYYKLIIDKKTSLPYMVFDSNSISKDQYYTKTVFTNINISPEIPQTNSWYSSSYQGYEPEKKEAGNPLAKPGSLLPNWSLPIYDSNASNSLKSENLKGKIVLMEFWNKNCRYCMLAFPKMKELQKKYGKQIAMLSINAYEKKEEVGFFYKREQPAYTMLYEGEKLANSLGIYAYPVVILTDKHGKIAYVGEGFDEKQVEKEILKLLSRP